MHLSRPAKFRSVLATGAALSLAALSVPAGAATSTAAEGVAKSGLTVLRVNVDDVSVVAGRVTAVADNSTSPHTAKLVVTPISSSATGPVGQQTITADDGAVTVPTTPKSVDLPAGLGSVTGPTLAVSATDTATKVLTTAALKALGKVTLLTLPIDLKAATLSDVSRVTAAGATAQKKLVVGSLALPSLQDLLAGLGIDLDALLSQLTQGKLTQLAGLVTSTATGAVSTANAAVDTAQAAIGSGAPATLGKAQTGLAGAQSALTTAQGTLTTATAAFNTAFGALSTVSLSALGVPAGTTADQFLGLSSALQSSVDALTSADLVSLATAVQTAEAAVTAAQAAVDQLQALVTALTQLVAAVLDALATSDDPLAELGNIRVVTSAVAAKTPSAKADVSVGDLSVLGATAPVAQLESVLGDVTDTLSNVLNSVAGVSFTAPTISVGTPSHSTRTSGTTRIATAAVTGVTVNLPSVTLPNALSIAGVPQGISGSISVGALTENAKWTPGTAAQSGTPNTPDTPGGSLPDTGSSLLLSIAGLLIVGVGLAVRRFGQHPAAEG